MSVSLYNTGVSGLLAAQQQLATTSNNIANVNTEGYNRQRAEQNLGWPQPRSWAPTGGRPPSHHSPLCVLKVGRVPLDRSQ